MMTMMATCLRIVVIRLSKGSKAASRFEPIKPAARAHTRQVGSRWSIRNKKLLAAHKSHLICVQTADLIVLGRTLYTLDPNGTRQRAGQVSKSILVMRHPLTR